MSSNRLIYDTCAYKQDLHETMIPLDLVLDPIMYVSSNPCAHQFGIVNGNDVSVVEDPVQLESELKGITRHNSRCVKFKYQPTREHTNLILGPKPGCTPTSLNVDMKHLPTCQMIHYKPIPLTPPAVPTQCQQFKS